MKNKFLLMILALILVCGLTACNLFMPYDPDDFIGLNSDEIIAKYGEFDVHKATLRATEAAYLYCNGSCGYMVKEEQVGFLGTDPPEYFMIYFDANGIAYKCTYETGGWGG